jgi:TetR/AcrR family transcriptional regulator, regulator of cefoperazone and chloramphenicol sensitivity
MKTAKRRAAPVARDDRAEDTKQRLLLAAIEVFGRHGFEAASTRMLTEAAGTNLQSIPYYFGSKEGLYLAVAEYISERVQDRVLPLALTIREALQKAASTPEKRPTPEQARGLLQQLMTTMAHVFLHDESEAWARYIIREQMEPTAAFDHLYQRVFSPQFELVRTLVGCALGKDPNSEQIRLRSLATVGQILVLRAARATLMRQLSWTSIGDDEQAAVDALISNLVAALVPPATSAASPKPKPGKKP